MQASGVNRFRPFVKYVALGRVQQHKLYRLMELEGHVCEIIIKSLLES